MQLFPLGMLNANNCTGTLDNDGITYTFYEPNVSCKSSNVYTTLVSRFETQTILARKKAEPYIVITYEYKDIYDRELRQVEHFVDKMEGELTSFHVVDLHHGESPISVSKDSSWVITLEKTRLYSTTTNHKANYAFAWDGLNFRIGQVSAISAGTSITISRDYGSLTATNASSNGIIYPIYECYFNTNPMPNFRPGDYIDAKQNSSDSGGYLWTGDTVFVSKYKV